ncbi:MAG: hypothetical protein DRI34_08575 [Deltaproteobacteria bacterium]|nr:MAG: hypothetical protein DRI34_08575 [Deltaproteobacteria bacterium]
MGRTVQYRQWTRLSDERLLQVRLCDLGLAIEGSVLEERIARVQRELERRGLLFRPYFWLSDDWFTPENVTGVAVPFYLAHPRLVRLERKYLGEVEGGNRDWCLRILRHEVGHALDHAFGLHRRRRWRQLFGPASRHYPSGYRPDPYSRQHVLNLEYWYAQAHPDEDFAESFAVWLKPRWLWRRRYASWPRALAKLEYLDELMAELAGTRPPHTTRVRVDSLPQLRQTLGEYYRRKLRRQGQGFPDYYDGVLRRVFRRADRREQAVPAWSVLRRVRPLALRRASAWAGDQRHSLDLLLRDLAGRCRELGLYATDVKRQSQPQFALGLARQAMDSLHRNRHWVRM